jgi:hypothetical protein
MIDIFLKPGVVMVATGILLLQAFSGFVNISGRRSEVD